MQRLVLAGAVAIAAAVLAGTTAVGDHEPRYRALGDDASVDHGAETDGRPRGADQRPPRQPLHARPRRRPVPDPAHHAVRWRTGRGREHRRAVQPDRPRLRHATATCSSPTARASSPCARAPHRRRPRPSTRPTSPAPTASPSTATAGCGSPTAPPRRAACGGSAPTAIPVEMFRVQPMANDVNVDAGVGGVGRDNRSLPPGTITITPTGRQASNTLGSQHLVANGIAFDSDGDLFVADTARGAIWHVAIDHKGRVKSPMGCDTTFTSNTLCLDNVLVAHPFLEGVDGIVLDRSGQHHRRRQRAQRDRRRHPKRPHGRAVPQPGRPDDAAAQRGPARVPDEPGDRRPHAVRDELRRRAARQLPNTARRGRPPARAREGVVPR